MYSNANALAQDVKREVLAELQPGNHYAPNTNYYGANPFSYLQNPSGNYAQISNDSSYQTIKDSVKKEILADIQKDRDQQLARIYGLDRTLSDQRVQELVDARYRTLDNMKADIRKELLSLQRMESQRAADPYVRQAASSLAQEAWRQGIPLQELTQQLGRKNVSGSGLASKVSDFFNVGQRKGFTYGMVLTCLAHWLWPKARNNFHSVAVRSLEEGMSVVDRAKSFVSGHFQPTQVTNNPTENPATPSVTNQPPGSY